jgi:hypothetical protein
MRDYNFFVKTVSWFHRNRGRCADSVEKWLAIHQGFTNLQQFNTLQISVWYSVAMAIAPKRGVDNVEATVYFRSRRRLKGLAKINRC